MRASHCWRSFPAAAYILSGPPFLNNLQRPLLRAVRRSRYKRGRVAGRASRRDTLRQPNMSQCAPSIAAPRWASAIIGESIFAALSDVKFRQKCDLPSDIRGEIAPIMKRDGYRHRGRFMRHCREQHDDLHAIQTNADFGMK